MLCVVDTGRPLIESDLLSRVQAVELAAKGGSNAPRVDNQYVLARLLHCGTCGRTMPGYTTSKYKGERCYKYRKYGCTGRSNRQVRVR